MWQVAIFTIASASCTWAFQAQLAGDGTYTLSFSDENLEWGNTILASPPLKPIDMIAGGTDEFYSRDGGYAKWSNMKDDVVAIHLAYPNSGSLGASFTFPSDQLFYGVWEYPFNGSITNHYSLPDIGLGNEEGINWSNARAPFFFTNSGFGVYVDSQQVGTFDFSQKDKVTFNFSTNALTYYVLYNPDLEALVSTYIGLSSKIQMPPDSGYGPIFWSDDFEEDFHDGVTNAQENYYDVINHLYYNQIRATAMFADRPYGTGNMSFGNFDFDPRYYPTPEQFIANLSTYGFDFQVWVANRAFLDTELYNASAANGWLMPGIDPINFLGPALNLSIPAAYEYLLDKLSYYPRLGVKGYKIDRGEEGEMPEWEQNIQNVLFDKLCQESMSQIHGDDFYNFARASFDRSRSTVSAVWNGDSHSNFTGLTYSIASAIRAGLLGFSQWGSDTGGYVRGANDPSEELWARWMWFSAFSPMYEIMVGTNHTPWYPPYTERLMDVLKKSTHVHTSLVPYIRSYTYQATQAGLPVVRALFLEYGDDKSVEEIADEYAFGHEFLVAPVHSAGGSRKVYFPKGKGRFLEWFNKTEVYDGGQTINITDMPPGYSPVYVREGAIIPTGDVFQGNAKWNKSWKPYLQIEVYPSFEVPTSTFEYYKGNSSGTATITVSTDQKNAIVTVVYEQLGVDAELLLYKKGGVQNITLSSGGGKVVIGKFDSLFD